MENKKVFTIIYALSIVGIVGAFFMAIYNITFANSGIASMTAEIEKLYKITNILAIVMIALLMFIMLLNVFLNDKFYWFEISFAGALIIAMIVMLSLNTKSLSTSAFIMVWFEVLSSCVLLIISKLCSKFLKCKEAKEVKNEENN